MSKVTKNATCRMFINRGCKVSGLVRVDQTLALGHERPQIADRIIHHGQEWEVGREAMSSGLADTDYPHYGPDFRFSPKAPCVGSYGSPEAAAMRGCAGYCGYDVLGVLGSVSGVEYFRFIRVNTTRIQIALRSVPSPLPLAAISR